jgi:hypothetical protein
MIFAIFILGLIFTFFASMFLFFAGEKHRKEGKKTFYASYHRAVVDEGMFALVVFAILVWPLALIATILALIIYWSLIYTKKLTYYILDNPPDIHIKKK